MVCSELAVELNVSLAIQPATEGSEENITSTDNRIPGVIELRTFLGPFTRFHLRINETTTMTADVPSQQARDYFVSQNVVLTFVPGACQVLPLDAREEELEKWAEAETV